MSLKKLACLFLVVLPLAIGCQPPAEKGKSGGESSGGGKPDTNATSAVDTTDATTQLVMSVEGMQCAVACPPAVRDALKSVDGVAEVKVDFETKTATVNVNPTKFDQTKALEALTNAGFTATVN